MSLADKAATVNGNNATILENVDKVYEAGKKAEYDRFWDAYQNSGNRITYANAFSGIGWTLDTFTPKYDIFPTGGSAYMLFRDSRINGDLVEILAKLGVELSFKDTMQAQYTFENTTFTRVGVCDFNNANFISMIYAFSKTTVLHTIDKIILPTGSARTIVFTNAFQNATALVNVTFEGEIKDTGLNFNWSPLSVASMKSIISCLKDLTGTDGEGVYTIQFSSACWEALEADSVAPNGGAWRDYVTDVLGWAI